jgi:glutaredoxin
MKDLNIIVYTMEGCPFCTDFKELLVKEGIEFFDRDIDVYEDEYETFCEITKNNMIPALLIIEGNDDDYKSYLYAPERNYDELTEAVTIINQHRKNAGIL